jgi:hypothetical protein
MARNFVRGYFPEFIVERIQRSDLPEVTHFSFAEVNPVISARFHLGQKRRMRSADCRRKQQAVR